MNKRLLPGLISLLAAQPAFSLDLMETYEKALSYDSGIASSSRQPAMSARAPCCPKSRRLGQQATQVSSPGIYPGGQTPMN